MKILFFSCSILLLTFPTLVLAEDLLPALCQQVLTPDANTSLPQLITKYVTERLEAVPSKLAKDARETVDNLANSLADSLEAAKSGTIASEGSRGGVLGTSTSMLGHPSWLDTMRNEAIDAASFLLRHWLWTLAGVGVLTVALLFKF